MKNDRVIHINFGILFAGILLIALGAAYLMSAAGIMYITLDFNWFQLLPLVIVFVGLALFSRSTALSVFMGFIVLITTLGLVGFTLFEHTSIESTRHILETHTITIPKEENTSTAYVYITLRDGEMRLYDGNKNLIDGELTTNFTYLTTQSDVEDEIQGIAIGSDGIWQGFGKRMNMLTLSLLKTIPTRLYISAAQSDAYIDVSKTMTELVAIKGESSKIDVVVGEELSEQTFEFNTPKSYISFSIPKTTGVRIATSPEVTLRSIPGFHKLGSLMYESDGYNLAKHVVTIKLVSSAELTVNWQE
jgi:hypothetical protein